MLPPIRNRLQLEVPVTRHSPTRHRVEILDTVAESIRDGFKLALVPADDEHPDAMPELTRALRPSSQIAPPDSSYTYLVLRAHGWRKQLSFKGRRLTVGQLLGRMRVEGWSAEEAADRFELPIAAVDEAVKYGAQFAALIASEHADDAAAAERLRIHAVPAR